MKTIKRIITLMIAMVIMCISVSSAFAVTVDTQLQLYKKMYDLLELCEESHFAFGVGYSITEPVVPGSPINTKYLNCSDTTELEKAWEEASAMVEGYFNGHISPYDGIISIETATEKYNILYEELHRIVINRSELKDLVDFCEKENNDNGYYDDKLWSDFKTEIDEAKELLIDENITDKRINSAFYELMYQFNLICTFNQIPGDLDKDGNMTVFDATYVQFYLTGYKDVNSSQLLVMGHYKADNIDIISATTIQRMCAKIIDDYEPMALELLIKELEKSNPDSEEFEMSSWRNNWIYYYVV